MVDTAVDTTQREGRWFLAAAAVTLAVTLIVYRQGLDLLGEGTWLLAGKTLWQGGRIYRDVAFDQGLAAPLSLLPAFVLLGPSALALAVTQALLTAATAGAAVGLTRRGGAGVWSALAVPGVLALGPVPGTLCFLTLLAWGAARVSWQPLARRDAALLGATAGLTAWWGLAGTLLAPLVLLGAWRSAPRSIGSAGRVMISTWLSVAVVGWLLLVGVGGTAGLSDTLWQPLQVQAERLSTHPFASTWQLITTRMAVPFEQLSTGEQLAAIFAGHGSWRTLALQTWLGLSWLTPLLLWLALRQRATHPAWGAAIALTIPVWISSLGLNSPTPLRAALLPAALSLPLVLASLPLPRWPRRGIAGAIGVLLLVPLAAEPLWLTLNWARLDVTTWSRPSARIVMHKDRVGDMEEVFENLPAGNIVDGGPSVLIWPRQPGLYALMDVDPPTRVVSLGRPVGDAETVLQQLRVARPRAAVLGLSPSYTGAHLDRSVPGAWNWIRNNYRILGHVARRGDSYMILERLVGGAEVLAGLPLRERVPLHQQTAANDASPAMRTGLSIGQSFPLGEDGVDGFAVRWRTEGQNLEVPMRVHVWGKGDERFDTLLDFFDVLVRIQQDRARTYIRLRPFPEGLAHQIAVTLEPQEVMSENVRLLWHRSDEAGGGQDRFEQGEALLDLEPIDADLYFLSY